MKFGIDAYFLNSPFSGIGQVTTQLLQVIQTLSAPEFLSGATPSTVYAPARSSSFVEEWAQIDCEFYLYMGEDSGLTFPRNFHQRILPVKGNKGRISKQWWEARQLPRAVRRDGCDVLLSLYQSATVMPPTFPHVMLVHDVISALFPEHTDTVRKRLALWLMLRGIRRASHRIAVSHHTKNDMVQHLGLPNDSISVAHIAAAIQFTAPVTPEGLAPVLRKYHLSSGYIYHGGGLHERKNAKGVLEAYAMLREESGRGTLPFALPQLVISGALAPGSPGTTDVAALAKMLGISDHVALLGQIPQADLPALYKGASVFLYPSRYEGFGLPLLEAMHQGIPVVTASTSSLPEVAGDAALYCDPDKPAELAQAVRTILESAEIRETLARRGLQRAATFTWDPFVEELIGTVMRLWKSRRRISEAPV